MVSRDRDASPREIVRFSSSEHSGYVSEKYKNDAYIAPSFLSFLVCFLFFVFCFALVGAL